jgi:hypothetical protein
MSLSGVYAIFVNLLHKCYKIFKKKYSIKNPMTRNTARTDCILILSCVTMNEGTIVIRRDPPMLPGVYHATKKDGTEYYRSSITYKNKHISLGSFCSEKDASSAYRYARQLLQDRTLSLESYDCHSALPSFAKWVTLLNFRDNGMYIKTPIYLKKNFFLYYFGPDDYLTFDIDDLFYYSTHSISRRGGHLFVADYGMQVNILSRYGIRNYAVAGRDYHFINGDNKDFRYENIEIVNRFHGVFSLERDSAPRYEARIHANGDWIIGRYNTETEAAVAYNKAASVLITKGYHKEYPVNYIEELSAGEYRRIYKNITISSRITSLKSRR